MLLLEGTLLLTVLLSPVPLSVLVQCLQPIDQHHRSVGQRCEDGARTLNPKQNSNSCVQKNESYISNINIDVSETSAETRLGNWNLF